VSSGSEYCQVTYMYELYVRCASAAQCHSIRTAGACELHKVSSAGSLIGVGLGRDVRLIVPHVAKRTHCRPVVSCCTVTVIWLLRVRNIQDNRHGTWEMYAQSDSNVMQPRGIVDTSTLSETANQSYMGQEF
jgi:hypothetical protein